jgi:RimJ/RimL family protein N-acetyltransferase
LINNFNFFCYRLKKSKYGSHYLYISEDNREFITFYPLTIDCQNYEHIFRLKKWRQLNKKYFYSKNYITYLSTNEYLKKYINSKKLRMIFYIKYKKSFIGHFELSNLSKDNKSLEITYILRGTKKYKGKMSDAINLISKLLTLKFKFKDLFIKVEKKNLRAINFYKKNNYYLYKKLNKILVFRFNNKKNNRKYKYHEIIK